MCFSSFCWNRRARWKTMHLEKDYVVLKRQFEAAKTENEALQAHNKQLQAEEHPPLTAHCSPKTTHNCTDPKLKPGLHFQLMSEQRHRMIQGSVYLARNNRLGHLIIEVNPIHGLTAKELLGEVFPS